MGDLVSLRGGQHFALEAEIADRIRSLIMEYEGKISLVSALGILELVKLELKDGA